MAVEPLVSRKSLLHYWWVPLVRGIAAIVFGVLTFVWPGLSILALVLLVAAYWIVDGGASIWFAVKEKHWGWPFWGGLLSLVAGLVAALQPGIATFSLVLVIAIWALIRGAFDMYTAIRLRDEIDFEWWLGASGALSILLGGLLLARPGAGALALVYVIGGFAIAIGALLVFASFKLRKLRDAGPKLRQALGSGFGR